ncbi:ABC transporter ATP-binding protein [Roseisalinus antarcticus]|uniref:High-affinity branched-chain amino acid transport ATP-binding protein LivF n=1 Tax=Roseisalinus antarcticus TaxID=254357 RepID=A0A1Y5TSE4_9RHOB|nr:ABC transporter ATP-binding protein [Roseisalinus antarcticus]SLN70814.1 High-affinity branched-chain amino acid transport ATP-binding protein LivF [Roseisalinus antarcticus]
MAPILSIEGLTAGYGKLPVLHDVSLALEQGRMLSIIGPNGAGKTTLTRAICGQCTVMSGAIRYDGRDIAGWPGQEIARAGIGYVPQSNNVFRALTVEENLEMSSLLMERAAQKAAIEAAYARFPRLTERRRQVGASLSGGERQMLAIASALLSEPRLLILDEPVSGLAPSMTDEVAHSISQIAKSGVTVVWVAEENPQMIIGLSDEVVVMTTGTIKLHQSAQEMLAAENFREIFLGI